MSTRAEAWGIDDFRRIGMYRFSLSGQGMVGFLQPIPITGWSVATVLPASELFAPAIKMMKLLIVITVIFVILIGELLLIAMARLIRPLQTLAVRAKEIAAGNLRGGLPAGYIRTMRLGSFHNPLTS